MVTVKFDDFDSSEDFNMILQDYHIPPAERVTKFVSIYGRNGDLDISPNPPQYKNRIITITFYVKKNINDINAYQYNLESKINGKRMKVVFSNEPGYYWNSRVFVDDVAKASNNYIIVKIQCNANPFKVDVATDKEVSLCIE